MQDKMSGFSGIEHSFKSFERETKRRELIQPAPPFPPEEMTEERRRVRVAESLDDYWKWRANYLTPEMYTNYAESSPFAHLLCRYARTPGVQWVLGSRGCAKTADGKAITAWLLLKGVHTFAGVMSNDLLNARSIIDDLKWIIFENPRIAYDFMPELICLNDDEFKFLMPHDGQIRTVRPFSENRLLRGSTVNFLRIQFVLLDDYETRESSFSEEAVNARIRSIADAIKSMEEGATLLALANNLNVDCMSNVLKTMQEEGELPDNWNVHIHPAWSDETGSIWPERWPAESEEEMKALMKPLDEEEWCGDFQQEPVEATGLLFNGMFTYDELPDDAHGVIWCDPNLSKKGKGDTTAITALLYSQRFLKWYIARYRCKSFSDSNELLDCVIEIRRELAGRIDAIGWDGNVNQESTWSMHVRNWSNLRGMPFPYVEYRNYTVDNITKTPSSEWKNGKILVPSGIKRTPEGKTYMSQVNAFKGKKNASGKKLRGKKKDAPDSLVCAYELAMELYVPFRSGGVSTSANTVRAITNSAFI